MRLREPEVEHLHRAVVADLDVGRLQIAMDDALLVRGFERLGDLLRDRQRFVERNRAARDPLREVLALDEFHDERRDASGCSSSPWMCAMFGWLSDGERPALRAEAREPIGVAGQRRGQHLDRDVAIQLRVARAIDLAHPAGADERGDFVGPETGPRSQSQAVLDYMGGAVRPTGFLPQNAAMFTGLGAGMRMADGLTRCVARGFCVTGSVAVGTPRDGQDTTGRESIIAAYLA